MDISSVFESIQKSIYQGFSSTKCSDIEWLNKMCGDFLILFKNIQKMLILDGNFDEYLMEDFFLYAAQVICCIRHLEKMLQIEKNNQIVLTPSRQFFLDRIRFCLSKISELQSDNPHVHHEELNLISLTDSVMDLLEPLTAFNSKDCENIAGQNAESMILSVKIRAQIEQLISHILSFGSVLVESDKRAISILCQNVWHECIALAEEYALGNCERNETNQRMKAELLDSSLCRLERLINDCLLRLVFHTFDAINHNPFQQLIEKDTDAFDTLNDSLMQIGIFAVAFAVDLKSKCIIRSSLASLESLEPHLIPAILSDCKLHSQLLQEHWTSEVNVLQYHIQKIIDTHAFCQSLLEFVEETIEMTSKFCDKTVIGNCLSRCEIFLTHFVINDKNLRTSETTLDLDKFSKDYRLMIKECRAVINANVTNDRIVKRLRILKSILTKGLKIFKKTSELNGKDGVKDSENSVKFTFDSSTNNDADVEESGKYFESFGIKPNQCSILYKAGANGSMIPVNSKNVTTNLTGPSMSSFRSRKKRMSLRVALFKKQQCIQTKQYAESFYQNSFDLQITNILDQLTELSDTFTTPKRNELIFKV